MMQFENPDPRGEYIRECPYCHEVFTAQHMNRQYCPEQNGIIDFCKNRYKRLAKLEKLEQSIIEEDLKLDTTIPSEEDELELIDAQDVKQQICNVGIMAATLGNRQTIKLPKYFLKEKGAVYETYDEQFQLPGSDLQVLTYGPYAMAWGYENHIILTHKTLIPWIQ
jgi:hypothetical protein